MNYFKLALKIVTVVPAVIDAIKFARAKVQARRKAKLTDAERAQASKDASKHLDKILDKIEEAKTK